MNHKSRRCKEDDLQVSCENNKTSTVKATIRYRIDKHLVYVRVCMASAHPSNHQPTQEEHGELLTCMNCLSVSASAASLSPASTSSVASEIIWSRNSRDPICLKASRAACGLFGKDKFQTVSENRGNKYLMAPN